ncbi:MAG: DEAD/DEAH box helicase [Firmicutes bacterium]|nr:DEAD/DEAH box helicase [Bacillota bacterium]
MPPFFAELLKRAPKPETPLVISEYATPSYKVNVLANGFKNVVRDLRLAHFDTWEWYSLAKQADELVIQQKHSSGLLALEHLKERWELTGVVPYPHQIETAERVVHEMQGQAILADEVGLGKTIEAGLILKEYILRGLAKKVLILTPASLLWQWYHELYEKFGIVAGIQRTRWDWEYSDILIASLDTAKREPHASIITNIVYDVLIIDEAHKLKNDNTASYRFVNSIQKKYCLMLTATPVQNDLKELYNLIGLLKPGQLGSFRSFKHRFMEDKRTPKNPLELRELLDQVMIRNRRDEGTVQFTQRIVHPIIVSLTPKEREIYEQVTNFVKDSGKRTGLQNILPLITLQREVCSSFLATALTLEKMMANMQPEDLERAASLLKSLAQVKQNSKCDALEKLVAQLDDKIIIFTEYKASQEYIRYRLEKAGYNTLAFDGSLSRGKKQWIRYMFQKEAQVLVSTESGGEGLNFQFCNQVVNFDLPWNPMRLEQRIGRVHRLGQTRDVQIFNLITKDTIEEHIMYLLHQKINMFETIIGELDAILLHLKLGKTFESELMEIFLAHEQQDEIRERLDDFADRFLRGQDEIRASNWEGSLFSS